MVEAGLTLACLEINKNNNNSCLLLFSHELSQAVSVPLYPTLFTFI